MCVRVSGQLSPSVKNPHPSSSSNKTTSMPTLHKVLFISLTFLFVAVTFTFLAVEAKHWKHHLIPFPIFGDGGEGGEGEDKPDFETKSKGHWDLISQNSGVSAMQINLMPNNKMNVYDATVYRLSRLKLPAGVPCVPFVVERTKEKRQDCFAHAMEYDIETNKVRPLKVGTQMCLCFLL